MNGTSWLAVAGMTFLSGLCVPMPICAEEPAPRAAPQPHYLADTDAAYRYLEKIQSVEAESFHKVFPDLVEKTSPPEIEEEQFHALGGTEEQLQEANQYRDYLASRPLPTKYENPRLYMGVFILLDKLNPVAASFQHGPVPPLRVGTLLSLGVTAQNLPVPQSNLDVVVMNRFLFTILHELTTLGVESLRNDSNEAVLMLRLVQLVGSFNMNRGQMPDFDRSLRTLDELKVAEKITETLEIFCLAHEYAHQLRRHENVDGADIELPQPGQGPLRLKVIERSWQQEIEADILAYQMVLRTLEDSWRPREESRELDELVRESPTELFRYLATIEDADEICRTLYLPTAPDQKLRESIASMATAALRSTSGGSARPPKIDPSFDVTKLRGHPPSWARHIVVSTAADADAARRALAARADTKGVGSDGAMALRKVQEHYARMGRSVFKNLGVLWGDARPVFLDTCIESAKRTQHAGR